MTDEKLIFTLIPRVMADVGPVEKGKTNTSGATFKYRGIDDVMNALQPAMIKHGIFFATRVVAQERVERESNQGRALFVTILTIEFTFYASDGSRVHVTTVGEAMDSGDKSSNKAMSIALKYALLQLFCIPTEDMADPDKDSYEVIPTARVRQDERPAKPAPQMSEAEQKVRAYIKEKAFSPNADQSATLRKMIAQINGGQSRFEDVKTWIDEQMM